MGLSKNVFVRRRRLGGDLGYKKSGMLGGQRTPKMYSIFKQRGVCVCQHERAGKGGCLWSICCMSSTAIGNALTSSPTASSESACHIVLFSSHR